MLVLSENAGAHEELGEWALTVNPFDVDGQAEAIHAGLIDAARRAAPSALDARSARTSGRTTSSRWIEAQLADLDRRRAAAAPVR